MRIVVTHSKHMLPIHYLDSGTKENKLGKNAYRNILFPNRVTVN
jgi:hypothetical protein